MKLITVIGARPQFVKAATVSRAFQAYPAIQEKIVHTGQHFDANMSDIFFSEMDIPQPHYHLEINSLSHGAMTGRMLEQIEKVLLQEKADALMVYGDTNSTLAGALAARKLQIPVIHVEAGLRSFNMAMPEEINRILTDRISSLLFCPSAAAMQHLIQEGFEHFPCEMVQVGDVMEDAARYYATRALQQSTLVAELNLTGRPYALATLHRAENTDHPVHMAAIVSALNTLHREVPVVLPLHPRTQKILETNGLHLDVILIPPVGYFDMLSLLQQSKIVLTDSGGLQKEAYFFDKFCITLRPETEWMELVDGGYNCLVGADEQLILDQTRAALHREFPARQDFYGGGNASRLIAQHLAARA